MYQRWVLGFTWAFVLALLALTAVAAEPATEFKEGVDYRAAPKPRAPDDPTKIEVLEFFSYACPHCYHFEADLSAWAKKLPKSVTFEHRPAIFNENWALLARAYYTAEALGILEKAHGEFYKFIHVDHKKLASESDIAAFFEKLGVKPDDFQSAWKGFSVTMKFGQAKALADENPYGITGTPSLIVQGKYVVLATNFPRMLATADFLIKKVAAESGIHQ